MKKKTLKNPPACYTTPQEAHAAPSGLPLKYLKLKDAFEIFETQKIPLKYFRDTPTPMMMIVSYDNKDAENNLKKDNASDGVIRCYYEC